MGFGMFGLMEILMPIMFVLVFGMVIVVFAKSLMQWNKNNHSPRLTVEALVVAKRTNVSHHHNGGEHHMHHTSTSYYVTFEVASGDRMELHVGGSDYGMMVEGDFGDLTFQGTRFLSFDRKMPAV